MRTIDADRLIKYIKNSNLEFIANGNALDFVLKTIYRQPIISKTVEIKNVEVFDNRKRL